MKFKTAKELNEERATYILEQFKRYRTYLKMPRTSPVAHGEEVTENLALTAAVLTLAHVLSAD